MWYRPNTIGIGAGPLRTIEVWERAEGSPTPFGATWVESEKAWNFAIYSRIATGVTLLLYSDEDFAEPVYQARLDPIQNKAGRTWHCFVPAQTASSARYYAYRI